MAGSATEHAPQSSKLANANGADPHTGRAASGARTGLSSDTSFPTEPEAQGLLLAGNESTKKQDFAHAQRLYAEGLAHATGIELRGALLSNRCAVLAYADRWDDALAVARECVELRPEWPRSHWCKGSALEGVGRHGEALDAFKKALELDPENEELASAVADLQARVSTPPRFGTVAFTFCSGTGNPVVTRVKQASNADLCGVEVGDLLVEIDERKVDGLTEEEVSTALGGMLGENMTVMFSRQEQDRGECFSLVLTRDTLKEKSCGYGCGYASNSVLQLQEHEVQECALKPATSNSPHRQSACKTRTAAVQAAYRDFQKPIEDIRRSVVGTGQTHADRLSRPTSPDFMTNGATAQSTGWQFQRLGGAKIAGKFRPKDTVVCMVNRDDISAGDVGVVMSKGRNERSVSVHFNNGEIDLCGDTEVRKCLYQDIIEFPDRQRKIEAERERQARATAAEAQARALREQELAGERVLLQSRLSGHGRVSSMEVPGARKDSFIRRVARSLSVRT